MCVCVCKGAGGKGRRKSSSDHLCRPFSLILNACSFEFIFTSAVDYIHHLPISATPPIWASVYVLFSLLRLHTLPIWNSLKSLSRVIREAGLISGIALTDYGLMKLTQYPWNIFNRPPDQKPSDDRTNSALHTCALTEECAGRAHCFLFRACLSPPPTLFVQCLKQTEATCLSFFLSALTYLHTSLTLDLILVSDSF